MCIILIFFYFFNKYRIINEIKTQKYRKDKHKINKILKVETNKTIQI